MSDTPHLTAARAGDQRAFGQLVEPYRRELQVHCYRLLGSLQDAEDLTQETFLRAWRRLDQFEGRASLRVWLYKIATHACLDALDRRPRRSLPPRLYPASDPNLPFAPPVLEPIWLEPLPDEWLSDATTAPEARYARHEGVTLAFMVALQTLPPRQRAVLILRDVLDWRANEVADLLDMTVAAVNSALLRARDTLKKKYHRSGGLENKQLPTTDNLRGQLERYVRAWEAADVATLVAMLKEDATFTMPPLPSWFGGRAALEIIFRTRVFGDLLGAGWRLMPSHANTQPTFIILRYDDNGVAQPFGLQVLTLEGEQIADITTFLDPRLLARFG